MSMFLVGLIFQQGIAVQAAHGDPDYSFGFFGVKTDHVFNKVMYPAAIAQQADCKLLVAGRMIGEGYPFDLLMLRRYNANGSVDTGFGLSGFAVYGGDEYISGKANSVTVQKDGKIVVAGGYYSFGSNDIKPAVFRFTATGYSDTSFGTPDPVFGYQGRASFGEGFAGQADNIGIYKDRLLTTIFQLVDSEPKLIRLYASGALDMNFGVSGMADIGIGYRTFTINRNGGKIVVGGSVPEVEPTVDTDPALQHFNTNGTPDTSHGSDGIAILNLNRRDCPYWNQYFYISGLDTQSDGKILAAGVRGTYNSSFTNFLIRVLSDDSLDLGFSGDGFAVACDGGGPPLILRASRTTTQVLFFTNFFSNPPKYLRRYNANGLQQLAFPVDYFPADFLIQSNDEKPVTVQTVTLGDIQLRRFLP